MKTLQLSALLLVTAGLLWSCGGVAENGANATPASSPTSEPGAETSAPAPDNTADEGGSGDASLSSDLWAVINTDRGNIWLLLFPNEAPLTVASFVNLAQRGFYDGLKFHRVINPFMIQGGDPQGTGSGGPGYRFKDEFSPKLRHDGPGVLSMANSGPATNGSQFFVTHVPTGHLDDKHSIFGRAVDSQSVVNAVVQGDKMNWIAILGDAKSHLDKHASQIDKWNVTLDRRFPKKQPVAAQHLAALEEQLGGKKQASKAMLADLEKKAVGALKKAAEARAREAEAMKKAKAVFDPMYQLAKDKGTPTGTGLIVYDVEVGSGRQPNRSNTVRVHCTGYLTSGKKFYSSYDKGPTGRGGQPIMNRVNGFVPGFTEGLLGMKEGGRRTLIIPGNLGYGPGGNRGAGIPGNATLVFDVELIEVK